MSTGEKREELSPIEREVERIVLRVLQSREAMPAGSPDEAGEYRRRLVLINAKEFITAREAAYLLGCSDGHIRNLVQKARKGRARYPIPFRDLDGVATFPRAELLKWAEVPKTRLMAAV